MQSTVEYTPEEFHNKLRSLCDQTNGSSYSRGYGLPVFGSYERKFFYGKIRDGQFSLMRNSPWSKNPFRIDGTFQATEDNRTRVEYSLICRQSMFWRLATIPIISLAINTWLYIATDIPAEGLLFFFVFFLIPMVYVPLENRRARNMLEVFKEEFQIQ